MSVDVRHIKFISIRIDASRNPFNSRYNRDSWSGGCTYYVGFGAYEHPIPSIFVPVDDAGPSGDEWNCTAVHDCLDQFGSCLEFLYMRGCIGASVWVERTHSDGQVGAGNVVCIEREITIQNVRNVRTLITGCETAVV